MRGCVRLRYGTHALAPGDTLRQAVTLVSVNAFTAVPIGLTFNCLT